MSSSALDRDTDRFEWKNMIQTRFSRLKNAHKNNIMQVAERRNSLVCKAVTSILKKEGKGK